MKFVAKIRYSELLQIENFITETQDLAKGSLCVVHTERGIEIGTVILPPEPLEEGKTMDEQRFVVRSLTEEDLQKQKELEGEEKKEFFFAKEKIEERSMEMKLSKVSHLLGGEKIIFYFLAEGRVDFRALVRDLAKEYKTRIEMRQVGARDEAKILGDVGHCGQQLCCSRFLKEFKPITMKMAKNQKATLDPRKISGVCGKLLCCLRYEDEVYTEALSKLPGIGAVVKTKHGAGPVIALDALKGIATVEIQDKGRIQMPKEDILQELAPPPEEKKWHNHKEDIPEENREENK